VATFATPVVADPICTKQCRSSKCSGSATTTDPPQGSGPAAHRYGAYPRDHGCHRAARVRQNYTAIPFLTHRGMRGDHSMTELVGIPVGILAPSALAGLAVLLILTGLLIPRRTYMDKAHEADQWRTESRIKDQQILELTEQNRAMLRAFGPTLTDFLAGLRRAGVGTREEGEDS
jgi:hypothetical protein